MCRQTAPGTAASGGGAAKLCHAVQANVIDFTSGLQAAGDGDVTFNKADMGFTFTFDPVTNLVGGPYWIAGSNGSSFGGGGGSSMVFDFMTDADVTLDSYTLGGELIQFGNPDFGMLQGVPALSASNQANAVSTFVFVSGPISLTAGVTYAFEVNTSGAAIQRQMRSWRFTVADDIPEPASLAWLASGLALLLARRRQSRPEQGNNRERSVSKLWARLLEDKGIRCRIAC